MTMPDSSAMTDRKLLAKVSCGIVTQWSHDGRETVCEGFLLACHALVLCRTGNYWRRFPVGLLRSGPMTDGKLSAKVSYWHVTHWSFAGQETIGEGFLWDCYAVVP